MGLESDLYTKITCGAIFIFHLLFRILRRAHGEPLSSLRGGDGQNFPLLLPSSLFFGLTGLCYEGEESVAKA